MADNFDGTAEIAAVLARIDDIAPGGVESVLRDDDDAPIDAFGDLVPYVVALFGDTERLGRDETLVEIAAQPFVLPFTLVFFASSAEQIRDMRAEVKRRFIDWRPTATSDSIQTAGGTLPVLDGKNKPSRVQATSHYMVDVNL